MEDTGATMLSLGMEEDSVMGNNIIMVVSELEIKEESMLMEESETKTVVYKNVSCQVDISSQDFVNVPIVFCAFDSASCEATTQCDIPILINHGFSSLTKDISLPNKRSMQDGKLDHDIASTIVQKEVIEAYNSDLINETIEEVILGSMNNEKNLGSPQIDLAETHELRSPLQKDTPTPTRRGRKRKPREDSEFDWSNDDFWEDDFICEPKKKSVSKNKTVRSYTKKSSSGNVKSKVKDKTHQKKTSFADLPTANIIKTEPESVESDTPYIKLVTEKDWCSDWITDDEVDDDDDGNPALNNFDKKTEDRVNSTCNVCMLKFSTPLLLLEHTEANHAAHICEICGFTTTFKHRLRRHMVKHSNVKSFVCDICGKQYSQNQNLRDHISRAHSDQDHGNRYPYSCPHCKRLYRDERNYMKHQEQSGGPCDICGITLECTGLLWVHRRNHYSHCHICRKEFQSRGSLLLHKSIKHGEKTLQCSKCPKKFVFQSHLKNHFNNAHSQAAPQFKCEECGFCAKTMNYLKAHHTRMHKNPPKVYSCKHCNKEFRSKARVIEHMRIHTGERPFSCPICFKTFYSQSNLYAHERTVHGRLTNYGTKDKEEDPNQVLIRRKMSSCYQCDLCQLMFPTHKKLKYHLLKDHNLDEDAMRDQKMTSVEMITTGTTDMTSVAIEMVNADDPGTVMNENSDGRGTMSVPAYVVPPNANLVEIDGVQYHVIRSNE